MIDTNVISEARKSSRANRGVISFLDEANQEAYELYLSVITIGEVRRGIEMLRHRHDEPQANMLENWLDALVDEYRERILDFDTDAAQVWGRLCTPDSTNAIDKQIAAIALIYDLTLVSRNLADFKATGVKLFDPFV